MNNADNPIFWNTENELIFMSDMLIDASKQTIDNIMRDALIEVRRRLDLLIDKFN